MVPEASASTWLLLCGKPWIRSFLWLVLYLGAPLDAYTPVLSQKILFVVSRWTELLFPAFPFFFRGFGPTTRQQSIVDSIRCIFFHLHEGRRRIF